MKVLRNDCGGEVSALPSSGDNKAALLWLPLNFEFHEYLVTGETGIFVVRKLQKVAL